MEDIDKTTRIDDPTTTSKIAAHTTQEADAGDSTKRPDDNEATTHGDGAQGPHVVKASITKTSGPNTVQPGKPRMDVVTAESTTFALNGYTYNCLQRFPMESGEAQIYLVERDGKQYVLKVYYPNYHLQEEILQAVCSTNVEMVMHIFEYGHTYVGGQERDYELMEYLEGGTLKDYKLDGNFNRFRAIALQAAAALACCHNVGIIHKDIKPANFFFRDKGHRELVLGDFGISSSFDEEDEYVRTTQARTPAFAAPEMYDDVIDGEVEINSKSDYYSLGITMLYVWLGRMPFGRNERDMIRMKQEGRIPQMSDLPPRVALLIRGLTSINPKRRWSYNEVERWYRGEEVAVDQSNAVLRYKTFVLDAERNITAHDVKELVPLLNENREIATSFLYNKRISTWLDECGNAKMAVMLTDIIEHRYPTQPQAGLLSAIFTLDPKYPFHDVRGATCADLHAVSISIMQNAADYLVLLKDPLHPYFLYLETHTDADVNRIRSYFSDPYADRRAIIKAVYETDPDMPFLAQAPSATVIEIVQAFGEDERTPDDWLSVIDGRLLAWMYRHCDVALCESTRILMEQQKMSERARAYAILYNIDRTAAFDLRQAKSESLVGQLMAEQMEQCQRLSDEAFEASMADFLEPRGRLHNYATLHQWTRTLRLLETCLPVDTREHRERLGVYDIKTAAYKICTGMGAHPLYRISDADGTAETWLHEPEDASMADKRLVRDEMRMGSLKQWMAVACHENPFADWGQPMSREHSIEHYLELVGQYDPADLHYKRFSKAKEEMDAKVSQSRTDWNTSQQRKRTWMLAFFGMAALWIIMLSSLGLHYSLNFHNNIYYYVCIPVGTAMAAMGAFYSYFRGNGVLFGLLWAIGGAATSFVPAGILDFCCWHFPNWLTTMSVILSIIYVVLAWLTAFNTSDGQLEQLRQVFEIDKDQALREQLYHTYKTHSFKFKGSNFALLDDAVAEARATSEERILNCIIWSILLVVMVVLFVLYHPSLIGLTPPDIWSWKLKWWELEHQIKTTL